MCAVVGNSMCLKIEEKVKEADPANEQRDHKCIIISDTKELGEGEHNKSQRQLSLLKQAYRQANEKNLLRKP